MADSIFDKGLLALKANLHDLVDGVIDMNSPGAIRQRIRDLEEGIENAQSAQAKATGRVTTLTRQQSQVEGRVEQLNKNIDLILGDNNPDNDHLATQMDLELQQLEANDAALKEQIISAQQLAASMSETVSKLQSKHAEMMLGLQRIEILDESTKSKEQSASAIRDAAELTEGLEGAGVDNIAARLQAKSDVADAKLNQALGTFKDSVDSQVALATTAQRLAARQARIQAEKGPTAETTPVATASS